MPMSELDQVLPPYNGGLDFDVGSKLHSKNKILKDNTAALSIFIYLSQLFGNLKS